MSDIFFTSEKVTEAFSRLAERIPPERLTRYLEAHGWEQQYDGLSEFHSVWMLTTEMGEFRSYVTVPMDPSIPGFHVRLGEVLAVLAFFERWEMRDLETGFIVTPPLELANG